MSEQIIWKDIPGYEGLYRVNQFGEIYSLITNKKLKHSVHKDGYFIYNLHKSKKAYLMTEHRAVALCFIPNPNNLPIINHKDENKQNNYYKNLEWCNNSYNMLYSDVGKRSAEKSAIPVYCYDLNGNLLYLFPSGKEAGRQLNFADGNINDCINHKRRKPVTHGYIFSKTPLTKEEALALLN